MSPELFGCIAIGKGIGHCEVYWMVNGGRTENETETVRESNLAEENVHASKHRAYHFSR
jgi:hypothetical protein